MNEWYTLTNNLETNVPALDEVSQARIEKRVRFSLPRRRKHRALAAIIAAVLPFPFVPAIWTNFNCCCGFSSASSRARMR